MAPRLLVLSVLAAGIVVPGAAAGAVPSCAAPSVDLVTSQVTTWGPDAAGRQHVDGLVTNRGADADSVRVRFSLLTAGGAVVESDVAYVAFAVVGHGESIGFDGVSTGAVPAGARARIDGVDALPATLVPNHAFSATATTQQHQASGAPGRLAGTIVNDSPTSVLAVKLTAVLRAADGTVAFVTSATTQAMLDGGLAPGASAPFDFPLDPGAPAWSSLVIQAEGDGPLAAQPTCPASSASIAAVDPPPAHTAVASSTLSAFTPLPPAPLPTSAAPTGSGARPTPATATSVAPALAGPVHRTGQVVDRHLVVDTIGVLVLLGAGFLVYAGLRLRATR